MGALVTTEEVMVGIREIFSSELDVDVPDHDVHLIREGYLDSMDVVRLLSAMSDRFGVAIELQDLEVTDLGTVSSLADVVVRHR